MNSVELKKLSLMHKKFVVYNIRINRYISNTGWVIDIKKAKRYDSMKTIKFLLGDKAFKIIEINETMVGKYI